MFTDEYRGCLENLRKQIKTNLKANLETKKNQHRKVDERLVIESEPTALFTPKEKEAGTLGSQCKRMGWDFEMAVVTES